MNHLKLRLLGSVMLICFLTACEKDNNSPASSRFIKNNDSFFSGADQIPSNTTVANGRTVGTYDKRSKLYNYTLSWGGLSSAVTAIHIHGLADRGFVALPAPLGTFPNGIVQTPSGFSTGTSGTYSGSLFVDNTVIRESDLLSGKFYIDIHTTKFPGGEIRGQITFP